MEEYRERVAARGPLQLHSQSQYFSRRVTTFNHLFAVVYSVAILALFYYHLASILNSTSFTSFFISLSLFISDVILAFSWITTQTNRINPIRRREFLENLKPLLKKDSDFPALDVFICTADPYMEPPMDVANTALSVLAYNYPTRKISVYISDDGGSAVTLFALMEAAKFAAEWLPFCRKNYLLERNPHAFFTSNKEDCYCNSEKEKIKIMYEKMKMRVENVMEKGNVEDEFINGEEEYLAFHKWTQSFTSKSHPAVIQVLLESTKHRDISGESLPNLVYVSRQKSLTSHHYFKAGALNTLIRVSATMTNAPIILTLDCDTYSNDPETPNRVLCYFLDSKLGNLSFVQFPQCFHEINKSDIYGTEYKRLWIVDKSGMDGLLGPANLGAGCFFVRRAFFGGPSSTSFESPELPELDPNHVVERAIKSREVLDLAYMVAGCNYENNTKWGFKLGFRYETISEDYFTGYCLHSKGWKSIFCHPNRTAFYGDAPKNLLGDLNQKKRWIVGLLNVGFSKYSPIIYGVKTMGLPMALCYSNNAYAWAFLSIPVTFYAFLPQLALINAISVFPKVSDPWFALYAFLLLGAYGQDLLEFILDGSTFKKWWNDQRMWSIRALSSYIFASIEFCLTSFGISSFHFNITNKVTDEEQNKRYDQELFEFGTPSPMFLPIATVAILNFAALLIGIWRSLGGEWEQLFLQMFLVGFVVLNCCPLYEAMLFRNDGGKLPPKITFLSLFLALLLCYLFSAFLYVI